MDEHYAIAQQFDIGNIIGITPYGNGRTHATYHIAAGTDEEYILQKLHSAFSPTLLEDFEHITAHLDARGLVTPALMKTKAGERGVRAENGLWRMMRYIPGTSHTAFTPAQAESAGALVGVFHRALGELSYSFRHALAGFHDTDAIMKRLAETLSREKGTEKHRALSAVGEYVCAEYASGKYHFDHLPERIIHGDLKADNIRFDKAGTHAVALLDLDTVGKNRIGIDLGDGIRSWTNAVDENNAAEARFDTDIFTAMMRGYLSEAHFMTREEIEALPDAVARITLELSARFITDAFEEAYFTLDTKKYPNLYEQNRTKAEGQMRFYRDFKNKKRLVAEILNDLAGKRA